MMSNTLTFHDLLRSDEPTHHAERSTCSGQPCAINYSLLNKKKGRTFVRPMQVNEKYRISFWLQSVSVL